MTSNKTRGDLINKMSWIRTCGREKHPKKNKISSHFIRNSRVRWNVYYIDVFQSFVDSFTCNWQRPWLTEILGFWRPRWRPEGPRYGDSSNESVCDSAAPADLLEICPIFAAASISGAFSHSIIKIEGQKSVFFAWVTCVLFPFVALV